MNLQLIIVYALIGYASIYSMYELVKLLMTDKGTCSGCSSCDIKKELQKKNLVKTSLLDKILRGKL